MAIARVQTDDRNINQLQQNISQALSPLLSNPFLNGVILTNTVLRAGIDTPVAHKLGRVLQGWSIVRVRAASNIYDKQDSNKTPESTLVLNSSADVTVDIYVF